MHALEPGELARVTLEKHENVEGGPYCVVRGMSMREQRAFAVEYDSIFEFKERDDFFDNIARLFRKVVVSIHGYASDEIEDAFSKEGMIEILRRLLAGRLLSYDEKKS